MASFFLFCEAIEFFLALFQQKLIFFDFFLKRSKKEASLERVRAGSLLLFIKKKVIPVFLCRQTQVRFKVEINFIDAVVTMVFFQRRENASVEKEKCRLQTREKIVAELSSEVGSFGHAFPSLIFMF